MLAFSGNALAQQQQAKPANAATPAKSPATANAAGAKPPATANAAAASQPAAQSAKAGKVPLKRMTNRQGLPADL